MPCRSGQRIKGVRPGHQGYEPDLQVRVALHQSAFSSRTYRWPDAAQVRAIDTTLTRIGSRRVMFVLARETDEQGYVRATTRRSERCLQGTA